MRRYNSWKGFTLIEVLLTTAVIGIFALGVLKVFDPMIARNFHLRGGTDMSPWGIGS